MNVPVYRWRCAPAHLRTRRQLATVGLRPNGQDIAGFLPYRRHGRACVAYLFDVNRAAPKRPATPAQLAALAKATRERQIQAAERRGISRAELTEAIDPWGEGTDPAPTNIQA